MSSNQRTPEAVPFPVGSHVMHRGQEGVVEDLQRSVQLDTDGIPRGRHVRFADGSRLVHIDDLIAWPKGDDPRPDKAVPDARAALAKLVNFIRADQCDQPCWCCHDYLSMADAAAREVGLPDGIECHRCDGDGVIGRDLERCQPCVGTGRLPFTAPPEPTQCPANALPPLTHTALGETIHVAHDRDRHAIERALEASRQLGISYGREEALREAQANAEPGHGLRCSRCGTLSDQLHCPTCAETMFPGWAGTQLETEVKRIISDVDAWLAVDGPVVQTHLASISARLKQALRSETATSPDAELRELVRTLLIYEWGDPAKGCEVAPPHASSMQEEKLWKRIAELVVPEKGEA